MSYSYSGSFDDKEEDKPKSAMVEKELYDIEKKRGDSLAKKNADLETKIVALSKTPRQKPQIVSNGDRSSPFAHIHVGLESLSLPASIHETGDTLAWAYDKTNISPAIQRDLTEIDRLLTLTDLSKDEVEAVAAEVTLSTAYNDHFGLSFVIRYLQAKISVKRKGREDALKILGGAAPKISVPTTLQKVRTMFRGRGEQKEEVSSEQEWQND